MNSQPDDFQNLPDDCLTIAYKSTGRLRYFDSPYKLIAEIDPAIAEYYRSLIPKSVRLNVPLHLPHISVVRREVPPILSPWGKYEGELVKFEYEPTIYNDETYYWLNAYGLALEAIRVELGLPVLGRPVSRAGFQRCFHITIGNLKKT